MAVGFPSGSNTYVPTYEQASGSVISYTRDPKKFRINQYTKIVPVKKDQGYYLKLNSADTIRVVTEKDFDWPDANDAPNGEDNNQGFEYKAYTTLRRAFPFRLGNKSVSQADWPIVAAHAKMAASLAMCSARWSARPC